MKELLITITIPLVLLGAMGSHSESFEKVHAEMSEERCYEGDINSCIDFCNRSYNLDWDTQDFCTDLEIEHNVVTKYGEMR